MTRSPNEASACAQSDQCLCCPQEETLHPYITKMRPVKILIRLDCTNAQADLSLRWAHSPKVRCLTFCLILFYKNSTRCWTLLLYYLVYLTHEKKCAFPWQKGCMWYANWKPHSPNGETKRTKTRDNLSFDVCDRRRIRLTCSSAQSNQGLCCLSEEIWDPWLSKERAIKIPIRLHGWTCWSLSSVGTHFFIQSNLNGSNIFGTMEIHPPPRSRHG